MDRANFPTTVIEEPEPFEFSYSALDVVFGRGCISKLGEILDGIGFNRAMVVTGSNVGANRDVIAPIEDALGERLVAIFDETTPEKSLNSVLDGVELMREHDVDVLVGTGGGSSLNVTRAMCAVASLDRSRDQIVQAVETKRKIPVLDDNREIVSNVVVPTTMAGADISNGGSVFISEEDSTSDPAGSNRTKITLSDERLKAAAILCDPNLYATTPVGLLSASAMNGFNKGIETLYSRDSTPMANAHAITALQHYRKGLPKLVDADVESVAYDHAVLATIFAQYGRKTNIVHTFGNEISSHYNVQQGAVHGIVIPHVLRFVFNTAYAHRHRIAEGLAIDVSGMDDDTVADAIIEKVCVTRDALGLPRHLREVDEIERDHFDVIARDILDSHKHARNPLGINPVAEDIVSILQAAW